MDTLRQTRAGFLELALACLLLAPLAQAAEDSVPAEPRFLGAASCSSTSCHGGAGDGKNQHLIWLKRDAHSRSYATLTSARSERFAEALGLGEAVSSQRCTVCHAPFHSIEGARRLPLANPMQGVSCENCHGPAEPWLRSHTRPDLAHDDRVAMGLRDLRNLYVRANACVACHQTLDPDLAKAGHPELRFELDGQAVSQPRHWREASDDAGPQAWLVGQAAALRELSWQLSRAENPDEEIQARWRGLWWLLRKLPGATDWPDLQADSRLTRPQYERAQELSDLLARQTAAQSWTNDITRRLLVQLSAVAPDFEDEIIPTGVHARRAERLVMGLERLVIRLPDPEAKTLAVPLRDLFQRVQSLPTFEPRPFAAALRRFAGAVPSTP